MFPNRPRLRVGLSRNNLTSSRISRPLSATRPPLKPLHNRSISQPKRTTTKPNTSATRPGTSSDDAKKSKLYFTVLYAKNSRKKHKSWLDGFIVVTDDRHVAMHNDDGKHMLSERVPKLGGLVEGNTLELRSWLLEVQSTIPEDDFISGRAFLKEVITKPVPVQQQRRAFKPLQPRGKKRTPSAAGPLHDPKAPNAVILADGEVPVVLDPCLARRMRPHQVSGVKFLFNSVRSGAGAILADDMGLGKSLQAIALVLTLLRQGRSQAGLAAKAIIVCPASLVTNWVNEVKKWLGEDRLKPVAVSSGSSTFESKQALAAFINGSVRKLLIVSYEMFRSYADELYRADVGLLVCDEGHRLKSSQGNKTIEALKKLPCRRRVILTGTPVQNDLEEFFAVCDFVNPGCLNSLQSFRSIFAAPIIASRDSNASSATVHLGEARARELGKVTSKFVLRRTSSILERYLPTKLETAIFCRLQPCQEQAYEKEAQYRYADIDTYRFSAALSAINVLRKICSHPTLAKSSEQNADDSNGEQGNEQNESVKGEGGVLRNFKVNDSSKMQIAMSICEASLAVGDKVIFVSNFTTTLDLVQHALTQRKISFCRLDGSTPVAQRGDIVKRFNRGTLGDIFLLSAKAGGVGLNLIGANRLILFDPDWNPATDLQAMARVWRDGQKKRVSVYRLLSTGTIEEKIFQRQLFKGELQTALSSGSSGATGVHNMKTEGVLAGKEGNFSAEQLRDLFQYNGKHEFCETLQVLERSQIESKHESEFDLEDDFEESSVKNDGLLTRFSQYKERFKAENGVKDYIFCDEDDVLDKALNSDLATHGLVSYLYTQRSGSAEKADDKYQPPSLQKTELKKRERRSDGGKAAKDDMVQEVSQKKRKLKPMFSDDAGSNETECESDPELAILEVMERSAARQRAKRNSISAAETRKLQSTKTKMMKPSDPGKEDIRTSGDERKLREAAISKEAPAKATVEIEDTWDEAVQALEVDDIAGFI